MIEFRNPWPGQVGEHFSVSLIGFEGGGIQMEAQVSHMQGQRVGFVCKQIDLASRFRLRDLIERSAADKERFLRELKDWW